MVTLSGAKGAISSLAAFASLSVTLVALAAACGGDEGGAVGPADRLLRGGVVYTVDAPIHAVRVMRTIVEGRTVFQRGSRGLEITAD